MAAWLCFKLWVWLTLTPVLKDALIVGMTEAPESQPSHTSIFQASASITLVNAPLAQRVTQIISKSSWGDICSMQKEVKHVVTWTNLTSRGRKKTLLMRKAGERKAL